MSPKLTQKRAKPSVVSASSSPLRWVLTCAVVALAAYLILGSSELWQIGEKRKSLTELEAQVARLESETDSLKTILWRLENDPAFVEKVAREEYGLQKKGERVYELPVDKKEQKK